MNNEITLNANETQSLIPKRNGLHVLHIGSGDSDAFDGATVQALQMNARLLANSTAAARAEVHLIGNAPVNFIATGAGANTTINCGIEYMP